MRRKIDLLAGNTIFNRDVKGEANKTIFFGGKSHALSFQWKGSFSVCEIHAICGVN